MFSSKLNLSPLFRKEYTTVQLSTTKMFLLKVTCKMSHPTINFWFGIEVVDVEKICPPVLVTKWFFLYYKPSRTLAEKFTYFNVKKQHKHVGWSQPARKIISTSLNIREGGNFLKKLCCCVGGRVREGNLVLPTELVTKVGHRREFKSWRVFWVSALCRSDEGLRLESSAMKLFTVANSLNIFRED